MTLRRLALWAGGPTSLRGSPSFSKVEASPASEDFRPHPETFVHVASGGEEGSGSGEGSDDLRLPGERLSVFGHDRFGDNLLRGEIVLTSPSLATEAAALSLMTVPPEHGTRDGQDWDRRNPYDIRGQILLAMVAEDSTALIACYRHGVRYLTAWASRRGYVYGRPVFEAAAADALHRFYYRRDTRSKAWSLRRRAKALQMSPESLGQLRRVCLCMYRARFLEALVAFERQNR